MKTFSITDFGAVAGGEVKNTEAFAAAIAAVKEAGGGTVVVPPGVWLTGAVHLVSHMTLELQSGATLLFSQDFEDYPFVESRWAGTELWMFSPLLFGKDLENVTITGKGTIDGNPQKWWDYFQMVMADGDTKPLGDLEKQLAKLNKGRYELTDAGGGGLFAQFLRPPLLEMNNCRDVRLDGFVVQNSPFWNTHLTYCTNVTVHDVTFRNPNGAPNGDGLDLDSCNGVRVSNCCFDTNDDCLALKSGMNDDGHRVGKPTENVTITNCTMLRGHGGVVMGSDGAGGVRRVTVSNCIFIGSDRGIRLKSNRGRYSVFQDIRFENIIMQNVMCPIVMNLYYTCGATEYTREMIADPGEREILTSTPWIKNIHIANVTSRGHSAAAGVMLGLPERPIENVTLDNVEIDVIPRDFPYCPACAFNMPDDMNGQGFWGKHIKGLKIRNCSIRVDDRSAIELHDSEGLEVINTRLHSERSDAALIQLANVSDAWIDAPRHDPVRHGPLLSVTGEESSDITLSRLRKGDAKSAVHVDGSADDGSVQILP